jgi:hypothetical protein
VKLNETVDILQKRVQSIETDIKDVHTNTEYVANEVRMTRAYNKQENQQEGGVEGGGGGGDSFLTSSNNNKSYLNNQSNNTISATAATTTTTTIRRNPSTANTNILNGLMQTSNAQWSLSLTPKGLRIDTNIISLHDLYDILLSGVSQFDLTGGHSRNSCIHDVDSISSNSSTSSITNQPDSPRPESATIVKKKPLWKSRLKTFPLYSSWEPEQRNNYKSSSNSNNGSNINYGNDNSIESMQQQQPQQMVDYNSRETMQEMIKIFGECFLCLPCSNPSKSIATRFADSTLDPLLANSVFAWTARHGAIYHNLFPGQDPNQVGQPYFSKAKSIVKDRFMKTSVDTMHSLLIMYIYAIGIPSEQKAEVESEAYIYLGLAIRMILDLKMHQESKSTNPYEKEKNRRFFWVAYFLETLGSIHSDKPFSLPPKNMITVHFPTVMEHEQFGESRYRVEFMIQRFKITRIYRNIIYKTAEEKPLLSQISAIDKDLEKWHSELPCYFKYSPGDVHIRRWDTTSFKEQACIKLNFEYNFQLCQLYGLFFNKSSDDEQQPSTIEVLSRDICLKAARNTVELLECWVQLKQLWCHFSLENLMMTTMIYGNILSQPNSSEREIAKLNLEKMAKILLSSPVRHHKYVLTLVNKIRAIFQDTLKTNMVIDEDMDAVQSFPNSTHTPATTVTTTAAAIDSNSTPPRQSIPQQPPQQQLQSQPQIILTSNPPTIGPSNNSGIQPISLTNQFAAQPQQSQQQQRNPIFNVLDVAPASSAFDIHKTDAFSEDMHFSDFVYTPTLLDYGTATNNTGLLSTVMETAPYHQQHQGKATVTNNTSSPYIQQRYSPPFNNFGYNTTTKNHDTPQTRTLHSVTPPPPIPHHHLNNNNYQQSSPQPWINIETSNTNTSTDAPVMLNKSLDERHPYLKMSAYNNNDPQQQQHHNLKSPPSQHSQPSTHQPLPPPEAPKNYYNTNDNSNGGAYGGPYY